MKRHFPVNVANLGFWVTGINLGVVVIVGVDIETAVYVLQRIKGGADFSKKAIFPGQISYAWLKLVLSCWLKYFSTSRVPSEFSVRPIYGGSCIRYTAGGIHGFEIMAC